MADEWEFQVGDVLQFWSKGKIDDGLRMITEINYETQSYHYENLYNGEMQRGDKKFVEGVDSRDGTKNYTKVG